MKGATALKALLLSELPHACQLTYHYADAWSTVFLPIPFSSPFSFLNHCSSSSSSSSLIVVAFMAKEDALRVSLVWLAVIMAVVVLYSHSFKKMLVTYLVGVLGISGVLLPDWDFFNRNFSRWLSPLTLEERAAINPQGSVLRSFIQSPVRVVAYIIVYSYAFYKWWMFITS